MLTRNNIKNVVNSLDDETKDMLREQVYIYEYALLSLHVFNVGSYAAIDDITNDVPHDFESNGNNAYLPISELVDILDWTVLFNSTIVLQFNMILRG